VIVFKTVRLFDLHKSRVFHFHAPSLLTCRDWRLLVAELLVRSHGRWTAQVPYVSLVFTWVPPLLLAISHWYVTV